MNRRPWTALDVERLIAWRKAGVPVVECARRLGRHPLNCTRHLKKPGMVRAYHHLRDYEPQIRALAARDYSAPQIAEQLGLHPHTVRIWMRRLGLPRFSPRHPKQVALMKRIYRRLEVNHQTPTEARVSKLQIEALRMGWPQAATPHQARILQRLWQGPATLTQLLESLGYDLRPADGRRRSTSINTMLRKLKVAGLVLVRNLPGQGVRAVEYRLAPGVQPREHPRPRGKPGDGDYQSRTPRPIIRGVAREVKE